MPPHAAAALLPPSSFPTARRLNFFFYLPSPRAASRSWPCQSATTSWLALLVLHTPYDYEERHRAGTPRDPDGCRRQVVDPCRGGRQASVRGESGSSGHGGRHAPAAVLVQRGVVYDGGGQGWPPLPAVRRRARLQVSHPQQGRRLHVGAGAHEPGQGPHGSWRSTNRGSGGGGRRRRLSSATKIPPKLVTENSSSKEHWWHWLINRGDPGIMANAASGSADYSFLADPQ